MASIQKIRRSYRFCVLSAVMLLLFVSACKTTAQPATKNTAEQVQKLMEEKQTRTAAQQKIDSRLLQAIRENRGDKTGLSTEPANVGADKTGNLTVDIEGRVSDSLISNITSLGGTVLSSFKQYDAIRAKINLSKIETLAGYPEVKFIKPAAVAQTNRASHN